MFVGDAATLDVSFEVAMARLAALTGSGALTQVPADASAALLQLVGVYRVGPGEDCHRTAAVPLGGHLDRIAEAITRAGSAAGVGPVRDSGPGRAGSSALACGTRGPRQ